MSGFVVPEDTRRAQAAAAQPSLSAFVSANAGSGKTHVLAQRVIRLLLGGADPSRILCLTYTRAAAANMAGRVFRNLSRWATLPQDELAREIAELEGSIPDAGRIAFARRLFARALETPGGLKIQTIHAFCEAVLHQFPLEANIAGHFEMLDGQMEAALLAEARREMIADAADPAGGSALADAFAAVLELGGESGLEALLAAIVARRDALRRFIVEIGDGGPHFTPLFEAFGFSGAQTPAGLAAAVWPDGYFTPALAAALGDRAVRERDFLLHRRAQPHDDGAFDLLACRVRVDHRTAVHHRHHIPDRWQAVLHDDLDDMGRDGAIGFGDSDAFSVSRRRQICPSGGLRGAVEHALPAGTVRQQRAPVFVWVAPCCMGELVDEALCPESVLRVRHRAGKGWALYLKLPLQGATS